MGSYESGERLDGNCPLKQVREVAEVWGAGAGWPSPDLPEPVNQDRSPDAYSPAKPLAVESVQSVLKSPFSLWISISFSVSLINLTRSFVNFTGLYRRSTFCILPTFCLF